jgi:hypothetical protein
MFQLRRAQAGGELRKLSGGGGDMVANRSESESIAT